MTDRVTSKWTSALVELGLDRFPPIPPGERTEAQAALVTRYRSTWRSSMERANGSLGSAFDVTLRSPDLAAALMPLTDYLHELPSIAPRLKELIILMVAVERRCRIPWDAHVGKSRAVGWSDSDVLMIADGRMPALRSADELAVWSLTHEILADGRPADATHSQCVALLGERVVVDVIGLIAYYTLLTIFFNSATPDASPDHGEHPPWLKSPAAEQPTIGRV